jgi:hypothetical protein
MERRKAKKNKRNRAQLQPCKAEACGQAEAAVY